MERNADWDEQLEARYQEPGQVDSVDPLYRYFKKQIPRTYILEWLKRKHEYSISQPKKKK